MKVDQWKKLWWKVKKIVVASKMSGQPNKSKLSLDFNIGCHEDHPLRLLLADPQMQAKIVKRLQDSFKEVVLECKKDFVTKAAQTN